MSDLIAPHLAYLRAAGRSETSIETRRYWLDWAERNLPAGIEQALPHELAMLVGRPGWSANTRAACYSHLTGFYRWATRGRRPHLSYDPSTELDRPKVPAGVPRPVSDTELGHALAHAQPPFDLCVWLAAYAGLRCCELAALTRADVGPAWIRVLGKGAKTRLVATHPLLWQRIEALPPGLLVVGQRGAVFTGRYLARRFAAHMRAIGLVGPPRVTAHRFRHWFGTNVQAGLGDLRVTQELMGHASPSTTAGYTLVADERKRAAILALPPPARPPERVSGAALEDNAAPDVTTR